jgi:hypothetical protein
LARAASALRNDSTSSASQRGQGRCRAQCRVAFDLGVLRGRDPERLSADRRIGRQYDEVVHQFGPDRIENRPAQR